MVETPLKVTHSVNCRTTAPTLTVQMPTVMLYSLTLTQPPVVSSVHRVASGAFGLKYGAYTMHYKNTLTNNEWVNDGNGYKLEVQDFTSNSADDGGKYFYAEPESEWCVTEGCAFSIRLATQAESGNLKVQASLGNDMFVHMERQLVESGLHPV